MGRRAIPQIRLNRRAHGTDDRLRVVACLPVPRVIFVFLRFPIETKHPADAHRHGPTPLDSFRPGQAAHFSASSQALRKNIKAAAHPPNRLRGLYFQFGEELYEI